MNINFHYFTVKALASLAGFPEEEAQNIATYSQFVDDHTQYKTLVLDDVPVFAEHLAETKGNKWYFNPVTTGFTTYVEIARLSRLENQKKILIPFHFIPTKYTLDQEIKDRSKWRVLPASLNEKSHITELLLDAKEKYRKNPDSPLIGIRIGLLLHIFSDTYAHTGFSGFKGWENHAKVIKATNKASGADVTQDYSKFYIVSSIGHANIGHAPDDSHITYNITQKNTTNDNYTLKTSRNNAQIYLEAAHEILNYLRTCKDKKTVTTSQWAKIEEKLTKGFLTSHTDKAKLSEHWTEIFPDILFYYTPTRQNKIDNKFFYYNVVADEVIRKVNNQNLPTTIKRKTTLIEKN